MSESYYVPEEPREIIPVGKYKAHITGLIVKENIKVRGKHMADIYSPTYTVAQADNKEFVGREVYAKGIFRFKDAVGCEPNPSGNRNFKVFCDVLSIECESEEVDGKPRFKLPTLDEGMVLGLPVIVEVIHDSWTNTEGEEVASAKATNVYEWSQGKQKAVLPF